MSETNTSKRGKLVRNTLVFQLKLMADGFRDLLLLPISLLASLIGLLRGGENPDREFKEVLELGKQSEQWIDLFGNHALPENGHAVASMDALFSKVEETLKQQHKISAISDRAKVEIDQALKMLHEKAVKQGKADSSDQVEQDSPSKT